MATIAAADCAVVESSQFGSAVGILPIVASASSDKEEPLTPTDDPGHGQLVQWWRYWRPPLPAGVELSKPQDRAEALAKRLAEGVLGIELAKQPEGLIKSRTSGHCCGGRRPRDRGQLLSVEASFALDVEWAARGRVPPLPGATIPLVSHQSTGPPSTGASRPTFHQRSNHHPRRLVAGKPVTVVPNPARTPREIQVLRRALIWDAPARRPSVSLVRWKSQASSQRYGAEYQLPEAWELVDLLHGGMHEPTNPLAVPLASPASSSGSHGLRRAPGDSLVGRIAMYLGAPTPRIFGALWSRG